jgi:hypothetical protein
MQDASRDVEDELEAYDGDTPTCLDTVLGEEDMV